MNSIRSLRRQLERLERLPVFQARPQPNVMQQISDLGLCHLSDEELHVVIELKKREIELGTIEPVSADEVAVLTKLREAHDIEARRMGFQTYAHALRREATKVKKAAERQASRRVFDPWQTVAAWTRGMGLRLPEDEDPGLSGGPTP